MRDLAVITVIVALVFLGVLIAIYASAPYMALAVVATGLYIAFVKEDEEDKE